MKLTPDSLELMDEKLSANSLMSVMRQLVSSNGNGNPFLRPQLQRSNQCLNTFVGERISFREVRWRQKERKSDKDEKQSIEVDSK